MPGCSCVLQRGCTCRVASLPLPPPAPPCGNDASAAAPPRSQNLATSLPCHARAARLLTHAEYRAAAGRRPRVAIASGCPPPSSGRPRWSPASPAPPPTPLQATSGGSCPAALKNAVRATREQHDARHHPTPTSCSKLGPMCLCRPPLESGELWPTPSPDPHGSSRNYFCPLRTSFQRSRSLWTNSDSNPQGKN